ncbi:biotin-dependent carboxyltransferase family protein [Pseudonocardia acaciae]|uniref:5-oxoprolinase subunit C family protein n=1 Tax=Pseudonocardia acaciae TaxID=551276 RepID=UPI000685E572|nr:hypothetical protein [Pseudonocardia acaciae]
MTADTILVRAAGRTAIQDLGRAHASRRGVSANGALDEYSARAANALLGQPQATPLFEATGLPFVFSPSREVCIAVTGARADVTVDGRTVPQWCPLRVGAGGEVAVRAIREGLRVYVAVRARLDAPVFLGSVAPDRALGFGRALADGDLVGIRPTPGRPEVAGLLTSRLRPSSADRHVLSVVPGPEWSWFPEPRRWLFGREYVVDPRSNHVGIRLVGELPRFEQPPEMASRGVAIGAIEVTPARELVLLHRGRSITAGYPILAVAASVSLSRAGQLRPGDRVRLAETSLDEATAAYRRQRAVLDAIERAAHHGALTGRRR